MVVVDLVVWVMVMLFVLLIVCSIFFFVMIFVVVRVSFWRVAILSATARSRVIFYLLFL